MITVYKINADGTILTLQIEKSELTNYQNLGWSETKPVNLIESATGPKKSGEDTPYSSTTTATPSPFGYPALISDGAGGFQDVSVYLNGINPNGDWYYPGDEDVVLDKLSTQDIKTLQDRLVRTQWFSTENYSQEYGRPGRETRNALIKAMTASNYATGVGYDTSIDLELLNPGEEIYVPNRYRESDKATRLQTVDAIFNSIGRKPTTRERNYYEVLLKDLEEKEFYTDEDIARIGVEGPKVTTTTTPGKAITEVDEQEGLINIVGREPGTSTTTVEPIPGEFDAISRLQETVRGDYEGVLSRQQDVGRARNNIGNIAQSVMRLKALGG
jgi:hypothetical protein